jgi:Ni/Co efflux regulator RcnB
MPVMLRLPHFAALLLLAAPCVGAETPFTDPVPPAVIGRPLEQIKPSRPAKRKPVAARPDRPRPPVKTAKKPVTAPTHARAPVVPGPRAAAAPAPRTAVAPASPAPRTAVATAPRTTGPAAAPAAAVMGNAAPARAAKEAVDDRADPRARVAAEVGKGTRFASKRLDAGAYISSRYQALVRQYYEANPPAGKSARWKIGEPVPPKAALTGVPDDLRARLPVVPPGHQYVQVDGEVVLLAMQSRMVVDGVSRALR